MSAMDFAILAPVPRAHIESGEGIARTTGYVCFGSDKWELFREVERRRAGREVPVLLYASHNEELAEWGFVVAWTGLYIGVVEDASEKRRDEQAGHRPPTTARHPNDNARGWGVFWRVKALRELSAAERRELRELQSYRTGKDRDQRAPRGPEIIVRPPWI